MFKFLKDKLSKAVSIFSKKVEEEGEVKKEDSPAQKPIVDDASFNEIQEPHEIEDVVDELPETSTASPVEDLVLEKNLEEVIDYSDDKSDNDAINQAQLLAQKEDEARILEQERIARAKEQEEIELARLEEERRELARKKEALEQARLKAEQERKSEEERKLAELKSFQEKQKQEEKKGFFKKLFSKKEEPKPIAPQIVLEKEDFDKVNEDYSFKDEPDEKIEEAQEERPLVLDENVKQAKPQSQVITDEKKGFFGKIKESFTTVKISDDKFNDLFWDMELGMLENNVAVEVIEKVKEDLRSDLTSGKIARSSVEEIVHDSLKKSFESLFVEAQSFDLISRIKSGKKPFVIAFIGVNGSGKTTTMAKIAHLLKKNNLSVVFAASDTFRAAAIQQLQEHADKLDIKMIRHDYESDPAAVAFDAIKHAQAKGIDVVLIDTAGRLHTNDNLMNELKKLIRVNSPDLKIFIGESITGNDCVEQAKLFDEAVGIDAIVLAKADVDEKGGAAISVSYVTKKPILYLGTGQNYDDLTKFDSDLIIKNIGL